MSIHKPSTRTEFKEYVLRSLGKPVININVSNEQVEDSIEYALSYFIDYHYAGSNATYIKHQLVDADITNDYIVMDENIIGVKRVFPIGSNTGSSSDIFSPQYQMTLSMLPDMSNLDLVPYFMMRYQFAQIAELFTGQFPIRYNRVNDKLYLDCNKNKLVVGDYIIIECFTAINPTTDTDVWSERILQRHTAALVKKVWGQNLSKFEGIQLPGGVTMNGREIYSDAVAEIQEIESTYRDNYSIPPLDLVM
jgi:hypothetical protein